MKELKKIKKKTIQYPEKNEKEGSGGNESRQETRNLGREMK